MHSTDVLVDVGQTSENCNIYLIYKSGPVQLALKGRNRAARVRQAQGRRPEPVGGAVFGMGDSEWDAMAYGDVSLQYAAERAVLLTALVILRSKSGRSHHMTFFASAEPQLSDLHG